MKIICTLIAVILMLSGCMTTSKLWEEHSYIDSVSSFVLNKNNNDLIVTGKNYAYIFDVSNEFKQVLELSRTMEFTPMLSDFTLSKTGSISGNIYLSIKRSLVSEKEQSQLLLLGFTKGNSMTLTYKLSGSRYSLESEVDHIKLENEYKVKVIQESSAVKNVGQVMLTPATVVIDSVVVIPTTLLYGVLGVYMYSEQP
ncbi:hypothetical protein ACNPJX_004741 [Vibrio parahaemolyticus]|uniref:hypothetical protein n=1 Tax=Vibrio parahaemolyticus TaxID=670 RepID=UPI00084B4840|nr:hypothetical protein [Vibrio parahaemolyticus]EGQ9697666.1 hypothetical protein [Vibrio parahaemolyticus]EGR1962733.1 hypothetical protein [Vibrio parahaemolyticus]EGR1971356.1 hypothetical protein [Vibrio parahaemolyticus]ELA9302705.1 hypothetical protein [Vibrio parahaemolyticus]EME0131542.1 hypothetical protein [Vibrio parahaemolyticus]